MYNNGIERERARLDYTGVYMVYLEVTRLV